MAEKHSFNLNIPDSPAFDQKKYPEVFNDLMWIRLALNTIRNAIDSITGAVPVTATEAGATATGSKITRVVGKALEAIGPGAIVTLVNDSGTLGIRNATAGATPLYAKGFAAITAAVASGTSIEVVLEGSYQFVSGLTPGKTYYLSDAAGGFSDTPGTNTQVIGFAVSSTLLNFKPTLI